MNFQSSCLGPSTTAASTGFAGCGKAKLELTAKRAQQVTPNQVRENKQYLRAISKKRMKEVWP